jgi:hypothetical protein
MSIHYRSEVDQVRARHAEEIANLVRLLEIAGAELCSNKCESVKHEDRQWRHCPECEAIQAAIKDHNHA